MAIHVLIANAGFGHRYQGLMPKQYKLILNKTILEHTVSIFLKIDLIDSIHVLSALSDNIIDRYCGIFNDNRVKFLKCGGTKRLDTIKNALNHIKFSDNDWIMIHDVARPLISKEDIDKLIGQISSQEVGVILVAKVTDTLKIVNNNIIEETLKRDNVYHSLTPQMFRYKELYEAYSKVAIENLTDDAEVMERFGYKIKILEGKRNNIKITYPEDIEFVEFFLNKIHGNNL